MPLKLILNLFLSLQFIIGPYATAYAQEASGQYLDINELNRELDAFKVLILGTEEENNCPEAQEEEATGLSQILGFAYSECDNNLQSCLNVPYSSDPRSARRNQTQECLTPAEGGYLRTYSEQLIALEKRDRDQMAVNRFVRQREIEHTYNELFERAKNLKRQVSLIVNHNRVPSAQQREYVKKYVENVFVPARDFFVAMHSYSPSARNINAYYNELLMSFPARLFRGAEGVELKRRIEQGDKPGITFGLKVQAPRARVNRQYAMVIDPIMAFQRDITTLLKVPTARNYGRALKWQLLLTMIKHLQLYKGVLQGRGRIDIPAGCSQLTDGQTLPTQISVIPMSIEKRKEFLKKQLENMGLAYNSNGLGHENYYSYFVNNMNNSPLEKGFNGLLPFEKLEIAKVGSQGKNLAGRDVAKSAASVNDTTYFEDIIQLKQAEIHNAFTERVVGRNSRTDLDTFSGMSFRDYSQIEFETLTYHGVDLFQKILSKNQGQSVGSGTNAYHTKFLNEYYSYKSQQSGATAQKVTELLNGTLKRELQNTKIKIPFPKLYSNAGLKNWTLEQLFLFLEENKNNPNSDIVSAFRQTCSFSNNFHRTVRQRFCLNGRVQDRASTIESIHRLLADYGDMKNRRILFNPLRFYEANGLAYIYPLLQGIWNRLIKINSEQNSVISAAQINEYDFLVGQYELGNPWASARIGYLLARRLLYSLKRSHEEEQGSFLSNLLAPVMSENYSNYMNNLDQIISHFEDAGHVLKIDQPLNFYHADNLLSPAEKEYIFTQEVESKLEEHGAHTLQLPYDSETSFLARMDELNYETILTDEDADEAIRRILPRGLNRYEQDQLDSVKQSDLSAQGEFFKELYRQRGNLANQKQLYQMYAQAHGLRGGDDFNDERNNIKSLFLELDAAYKFPMYKDLVKKSWTQKVRKLENRMERFCNLSPNNTEGFVQLFQLTSKEQNQLNQLAGLPEVPEMAMDRSTDWTSFDWQDLYYGGGAMMTPMLALSVASSCGAMTAGACIPFALALFAAGAVGAAMQFKVIGNQITRHLDGQQQARFVGHLAELGYVDSSVSEEFTYSKWWTALEVIGAYSLFGILSRAGKVSLRLARASAASILHGTTRPSFNLAAKRIFAEADINLSRHVLGFDENIYNLDRDFFQNRADDILQDIQRSQISNREFRSLQTAYRRGLREVATGNRSLDSFINDIASRHLSVENIIRRHFNTARRNAARSTQRMSRRAMQAVSQSTLDMHFAETLTDYLNGSKNRLLRFVKAYTKKIEKAERVMESGPTGIPVISFFHRSFINLRHSHINRQKEALMAIEEALENLAPGREALLAYTRQNADTLQQALIGVPLRLSDIPIKLFEGIPQSHMLSFGRRVPVFGRFADNTNIRNIMRARASLLGHSLRSQAARVIGLSTREGAQIYKQFEVFRAFQNSIEVAAHQGSAEQREQLISSLTKYHEEIVEQVIDQLRRTRQGRARLRAGQVSLGNEIIPFTEEGVKNLLFYATTPAEKTLGGQLWRIVESKKMLVMDEIEEMAEVTLQRLSNYQNMDEFENFLNALKVLTYAKNSTAIEFL